MTILTQAKFMPHTSDSVLVTAARDGQIRCHVLSASGNLMTSKRVSHHRDSAHKVHWRLILEAKLRQETRISSLLCYRSCTRISRNFYIFIHLSENECTSLSVQVHPTPPPPPILKLHKTVLDSASESLWDTFLGIVSLDPHRMIGWNSCLPSSPAGTGAWQSSRLLELWWRWVSAVSRPQRKSRNQKQVNSTFASLILNLHCSSPLAKTSLIFRPHHQGGKGSGDIGVFSWSCAPSHDHMCSNTNLCKESHDYWTCGTKNWRQCPQTLSLHVWWGSP